MSDDLSKQAIVSAAQEWAEARDRLEEAKVEMEEREGDARTARSTVQLCCRAESEAWSRLVAIRGGQA